MYQAGAYPSPLNYHGFPKSCCTSVNEVICHGIPDDRKLEEGDIINIDITTYLNGYHGDCSEMFVAGEPDAEAKKLLQATYDCWIKACQYVKKGRDYKDLGAIIEDHVVPQGLSTVRNFCGHGIGNYSHDLESLFTFATNEMFSSPFFQAKRSTRLRISFTIETMNPTDKWHQGIPLRSNQ